MHLLPLVDVSVVPSIFPEAFGMVAAEAAAAYAEALRLAPAAPDAAGSPHPPFLVDHGV